MTEDSVPLPSPEADAIDGVQEKKFGLLALAFLVGLGISIPAYVIGHSKGRTKTQVEAVTSGHARYKVVDTSGRTQFEWLPATQVKYRVVDQAGNTEFEEGAKPTPKPEPK